MSASRKYEPEHQGAAEQTDIPHKWERDWPQSHRFYATEKRNRRYFEDFLQSAGDSFLLIFERIFAPLTVALCSRFFKKNMQGFSVIQLPRGIAPFLSTNENKCLQNTCLAWYTGCMKTNIARYRTCVCNINYHVVWCVKYRRKVITPQKEQLPESVKLSFKI